MHIGDRRTRLAAATLLLAASALTLSPADAVGTGVPVITSPTPGAAHYDGYTGPFVVNFDDAPKGTYHYAVFSDDGAPRLVAGPGSYQNTGVGADPQLRVHPLARDAHLRFKISDDAGHEAELIFAVKPGPAPRCALVVPSRVRVAAPVVKVGGRLSSTCATLHTQSADWKVTRAGQVLDYFHFVDNTTDTWSVFDADPMGSYTIVPLSARAADASDVPQNTPSVVVRRDSRLGIDGSRSGNRVTVRTRLSRYSPAANAFRPWARTHVVLAARSCTSCAWKPLRTLTTNLHGQATTTLTASAARDYRVTSAGTSQVWAALPKVARY